MHYGNGEKGIWDKFFCLDWYYFNIDLIILYSGIR